MINNTITGTQQGIFIDNGVGNKIRGNTISGHTGGGSMCGGGAGIEIHHGRSSISKDNAVNGNTNGLCTDGSSGSSIVRCNDFSSNAQDGVLMLAKGCCKTPGSTPRLTGAADAATWQIV